ncbi:MAG: Holliday junction branch migration protein RuvA [Oscillospiraceae bacterium]|jgi:Holliday junction DNA helicase RuvA|nr:Holliday junction branch migration protein RuvA [Oscillospiraceae bacterium]
MIYSVKGTLAHLEANFAVVECGGVGYGVRTSATTIAQLPKVGEEAMLYTYLHVTESGLDLFGFADAGELSCFKMLLGVTRVGPRAALSVLSSVTAAEFALCVASGDAKTLSRAPGLGMKTAQRIILELKDKLSKEQGAESFAAAAAIAPVKPGSGAGEAISALVVLGYTQSEAASAVASLPADTPVEEMIKAALKKLARQ